MSETIEADEELDLYFTTEQQEIIEDRWVLIRDSNEDELFSVFKDLGFVYSDMKHLKGIEFNIRFDYAWHTARAELAILMGCNPTELVSREVNMHTLYSEEDSEFHEIICYHLRSDKEVES